MKKKKMTLRELAKLEKMRKELEAKVKRKRQAQEEIQKIKELREELTPTARTKLKKFLIELPETTKQIGQGFAEFGEKVDKFSKKFEPKQKKTPKRKKTSGLVSLQDIAG